LHPDHPCGTLGEVWGIQGKSGRLGIMLENMFQGTFTHRMDVQGRIALPTRYREAFRSGVVLSKSYDPCVNVYTISQWQAHSSEFSFGSDTRSKNRLLMRMMFASAFESSLDKQGRILIPNQLRTYADLQDEIIFAGVGPVIEIWNQKNWEEQEGLIASEGWRIAESTEY
jgi:MraZ protein